jgi:2,3,4,5-tetrahydropyridine-2-carboxylate N-succinyltransferase
MTAPPVARAAASASQAHGTRIAEGTARPPQRAVDPRTVLAELDAGTVRAAYPDAGAPGGWRVDPTVKATIIARFADRRLRRWSAAEAFRFRDRVGLPVKRLEDGQPGNDPGERAPRIVPGGTSIRAGVHLGDGVVVMPPSFINIGAWIGADTMIDSHVLVGSCAQIGARVHLAAGVQVGGVLEPPGARPVIVEDEAFVGAGALLLDGVLVGRGAVIGAGVTLTGTTRVFDLVRDRVIAGAPGEPLAIPPRAVIVPGSRALEGPFARDHGLAVSVPLLVKDRDERTDARVALEEALR